MVAVSSPRPVGTDSGLTTAPGVLSCRIQPMPSPNATVATANVTAATAPIRRLARSQRQLPSSRAAQTGTRNPMASSAGAFTSMASVHSTTPAASRRCASRAPRRVSTAMVTPATISASITASLCPPPMKWMSSVNISSASHTATRGSPPHAVASRGRYRTVTSTPATATSRMASTVSPTWSRMNAEPLDEHFKDPLPLRIAAAAVQLLGLLVVALLTAVVVDVLVGARLVRVLGGVRGKLSGHIVVCGLGNVGVKVVQTLRQRGMPVVAVERNEDRSTVATARRLGAAVVIGDATLDETLRSAQVQRCRAVIAVTSDDVANLEAGLVARGHNPDARIVLRLFDTELAGQVDRKIGLGISRSVSILAAPSFAAAVLEQRVTAMIPVNRRVLLTTEVPVEPGSAAGGAAVSTLDQEGAVRVLAVRSGTGRWEWQPAPRRVLSPGDRVAVVATRAGLARTLLAARPPRR